MVGVASIKLIAVYVLVPEHCGRGRPPTRQQPQLGWQYVQVVKVRDEHGQFQETRLRVIYGEKAEALELLGKSTAYIERSQLTRQLFNGRQRRNTLASSKEIGYYRIGLRLCGKTLTITWFVCTRAYTSQYNRAVKIGERVHQLCLPG
jgi:hypothetical protein